MQQQTYINRLMKITDHHVPHVVDFPNEYQIAKNTIDFLLWTLFDGMHIITHHLDTKLYYGVTFGCFKKIGNSV